MIDEKPNMEKPASSAGKNLDASEPVEKRTLPPGFLAARRATIVSLMFCAIVLAALGVNAYRSRRVDILQPARLQQMEIDLNKRPTDEGLRRRIRVMDVRIRSDYFREKAFALDGFYLLLGGVCVFLLSLEAARHFREDSAEPNLAPRRDPWLDAAAERRSTLAMGAAFGGILLTLAVLSRHDNAAEYAKHAARESRAQIASATGATPSERENRAVATPPPTGSLPPAPENGSIPASAPDSASSVAPTLAPAPSSPGGPPGNAAGGVPLPSVNPGSGASATIPLASSSKAIPSKPRPSVTVSSLYPKEWAGQWPGFRGPGGDGISLAKDVPVSWSGTSGILWKAAVPLPGWSSPVIWGDRLFLTGGGQDRREVYAYDAGSGNLLWRKEAPSPPGASKLKPTDDTNYASPTIATDGKRICAIFYDATLACLDFDGKLLWSWHPEKIENSYGHAASLRIYQNLLIVQLDQGTSAGDGKSQMLALDLDSGKPVWRAKRPAPGSWSTPLLLRVGNRDQLITTANPWVIAYDPKNGEEIWRAQGLDGEVVPSPVQGGGFVFACNLGSSLLALRPNGTGDVTKTALAWKSSENLPDIVSPVTNGDLLFLCTSEGLLTCFDAKIGKKLWEKDLGATVHSSPILARNRLYLPDCDGKTHIVEAGRAYKEIGTPSVGDEISSSLALTDGRIYLRSKKYLYCIGKKR